MGDLTPEHIIGIHRGIMQDGGGDSRVLSEANLHQLVFRINREDDVIRKTAEALFLMVAYPSFRDGNKRTALAVAGAILAKNGYEISGKEESLFALLQMIASFEAEQEEIEGWVRENTRKKPGSAL